MRTYQKLLFFVGWVICLNYACDKHTSDLSIVETEEKYELLVDYGNLSNAYMRRHLVDYFQLVALGSEYGNDLPLVKKWKVPMQLYVNDQSNTTLMTELVSIIEELNGLFIDGFQIVMTDDSLAANYHVFLGEVDAYKRKYPSVAHLIGENRGLFTIQSDEKFNITSGHMFVETKAGIALRYQKHILREELTQSLGLPNDIKYYAESIFYEKWTDIQKYSDLDKETIRLLYHPRMVSKVGSRGAISILEGILGL